MTIAYSCVLLAVLLPYLWVGYAKFSSRGYNNRAPRPFLAKLEGRQARANWAHLNAFEALPPFIAAVLFAQLSGVGTELINGLALHFIFWRLAHGVSYIADKPLARSISWALALLTVIALFVLAISKSAAAY